MPPNRMSRIRLFASCYNKSDLKELISLYQQYDRPVNFSYLVKFCHISDKRERAKFQRLAISNGWTFNRIQTELLRRYGRQRHVAGRRPQMPSDTPGAITELDQMCVAWRRWHTVLAEDQAEAEKPHVGLDDLPAVVRKRLEEATEAVGRLEAVVDTHLRKYCSTGKRRLRARQGKQAAALLRSSARSSRS
jgi:hypothetical protein